VVPTRGGRSLTPKFVSCIYGLLKPMNQQIFGPVFMSGFEVGDAYNQAIEMILGHPQLSKMKFVLTSEDDTLPPPDGLMKLYESIGDYDVVGGLYFTKGEDGQPMIYGNPKQTPLNFIPQLVQPESLQHCNGMGMGFHLWKMEVFKKLKPPYFETRQRWDPATGTQMYTQDLATYEQLARLGMKVACDTRVKCGHYCCESNIVW
jgi:hypothetical protein